MKIFIGLILLCFCVFISYMLSEKYTLRKKFYNSFLTFCKRLKNEVTFSKETLLSILKKDLDKNDLFFKGLRKRFYNQDNIKVSFNFLSEDEIDYFKSFIENIGKTNAVQQYEFLSGTEKVIFEKLVVVQEEEKKYKSLYLKLGFLLGLLIFILII